MLDDYPSDENGSITIVVSAIGFAAVLLCLAVSERLITEYRATDDSLVRIRAYWAAAGEMSYAASRTIVSGANTDSGNVTRVAGIQLNYLQEIADNTSSLVKTWNYPESGTQYGFTVTPAVSLINNNADMSAKFSFGNMSNASEALRSVSLARPVVINYCIQNAAPAAMAWPPAQSSDNSTFCKAGGPDRGTAYDLVTSILRPIN